MSRMPDRRTDGQTLKDRATQLLRSRSRALVTQFFSILKPLGIAKRRLLKLVPLPSHEENCVGVVKSFEISTT